MIPTEMVVGFAGGAEPEVYGALAALSNETLAWMVEEHKKHGFKIESNKPDSIRAMGVTRYRPDGTTELVQIHPILVGDIRINVVLHELGHVVHKGRSTAAFEATLNEVYEKEGKSWFVGNYAQTSAAEYFAEAFNTYYCSASEALRLQRALPATYAFLREFAGTPYWSGGEMPAVSPGTASALSKTRPFIKNRYRLGVTMEDNDPNAIGVKIKTVTPGSAADKAGLKPGDAFVRIENFQNILSPDDVTFFVENTPGNTMNLRYKEQATGLYHEIIFPLDIVQRADEAPANTPPDLGACASASPCRDYLSQSFCKRASGNAAIKWHVAKTCQQVGTN
jgi:hypothetical protein